MATRNVWFEVPEVGPGGAVAIGGSVRMGPGVPAEHKSRPGHGVGVAPTGGVGMVAPQAVKTSDAATFHASSRRTLPRRSFLRLRVVALIWRGLRSRSMASAATRRTTLPTWGTEPTPEAVSAVWRRNTMSESSPLLFEPAQLRSDNSTCRTRGGGRC